MIPDYTKKTETLYKTMGKEMQLHTVYSKTNAETYIGKRVSHLGMRFLITRTERSDKRHLDMDGYKLFGKMILQVMTVPVKTPAKKGKKK